VRLVDRQQVDLAPPDRLEEEARREALRRAVDDFGAAVADAVERRHRIPFVHRRGDHRHRVAGLGQPQPLVLHQRDQRADDDRQVVGGEPRQLVAEALAAAGRHHDQRIAAFQGRDDRLSLPGPPVGVTELPQQFVRSFSCVDHDHSA